MDFQTELRGISPSYKNGEEKGLLQICSIIITNSFQATHTRKKNVNLELSVYANLSHVSACCRLILSVGTVNYTQ